MEKRGTGYIAISRQIFDNRMLENAEWFRAFQWLLGRAAWKPRGERLSFGVVDLERGQLAVTIRELAKTWNWPVSNVVYFLKRAQCNEMIEYFTIRTKSRTKNGIKKSYPVTKITICNYDEYQLAIRGAPRRVAQGVVQSPDSVMPYLPGIVAESAPNHLTNLTQESNLGEKRVNSPVPKEGARKLVDGFWIRWMTYGRDEWIKYAADYQEVRGVAIFPWIYIGGRGNWFYELGEAVNPNPPKQRKQA
jgi:hypothetical protein